MPNEEAAHATIEVASRRLRAAANEVVQKQEPLSCLCSLKWDILALRAELTTLRDMLRANGKLDTTEYQKRCKDEMDKYTDLIQRELGMIIREDGSTIETERSLKTLKKVWKPGEVQN